MFTVAADIELWPSNDRRFSLPSETRSMLFRFGEGADEFSVGAIATDGSGTRFEAGTQHHGVRLEFWANEAEAQIHPGDEFVIWYGGDVGKGRVRGA